jgi:hypothetical protein
MQELYFCQVILTHQLIFIRNIIQVITVIEVILYSIHCYYQLDYLNQWFYAKLDYILN